MSFKNIMGSVLIVLVVVGVLVIFFTSNGAVDTAQQSAEVIKNQVDGLNITDKADIVKEQTLNIWEKLFR